MGPINNVHLSKTQIFTTAYVYGLPAATRILKTAHSAYKNNSKFHISHERATFKSIKFKIHCKQKCYISQQCRDRQSLEPDRLHTLNVCL